MLHVTRRVPCPMHDSVPPIHGGAPPQFDEPAIKRAARKKWLLVHPDKCGSTPGAALAFRAVQEAERRLLIEVLISCAVGHKSSQQVTCMNSSSCAESSANVWKQAVIIGKRRLQDATPTGPEAEPSASFAPPSKPRT